MCACVCVKFVDNDDIGVHYFVCTDHCLEVKIYYIYSAKICGILNTFENVHLRYLTCPLFRFL